MKINFKNVIPIPIQNELSSSCGLWGNEIVFSSTESSLVEARSGKGKSTLTSFLAGVRTDYLGEILFNGEDIRKFSKNEWTNVRKTSLSFIYQDLQLFDKLTVKENLILKNQLTNFKTEAEIKEFLQALDIDSKWNQYCGNLSLGQQQRVAIIRSLLQPASFIIMDEPFSHLDEKNTELAIELIKQHCYTNHVGIILTSLGSKYNFKWDKQILIA